MCDFELGWRLLVDGALAKLVRWADAGAAHKPISKVSAKTTSKHPAAVEHMKLVQWAETGVVHEMQSSEEYMTAFAIARIIIGQNPAEVYTRVHVFMSDYLNAAFAALSAKGAEAAGLPAASAVGRLQGYRTVVKWISHIFSYLDTFYTVLSRLPLLSNSLNALVRQRLKAGGGNDLERLVLDAVATPLDEDLEGNPCSMRRYGVIQALAPAGTYATDLDETPQPAKQALIEAIKTERQAPDVARFWPDPGVDLAGAQFAGADGLLAHALVFGLDVDAIFAAAVSEQQRLRIAAMPKAVTRGLYTAGGELTAPLQDLMAVAYHRPRQLLLLGALVSRGADSASPLVGAPLALSADVASKVREALHQMPGLCPRAATGEPLAREEFAWHDDA